MKKLSAVTIAGGFLLIVLCGQSSAQSFSSLSQMFGGGSKQSRSSSQSNAAITVKRDASPFVGRFDGKQGASAGTHLKAQFACYPAHDSALPQDNTFVCYTAQASSGGPNASAEE
jgi:hypothetical protein